MRRITAALCGMLIGAAQTGKRDMPTMNQDELLVIDRSNISRNLLNLSGLRIGGATGEKANRSRIGLRRFENGLPRGTSSLPIAAEDAEKQCGNRCQKVDHRRPTLCRDRFPWQRKVRFFP